MSKPSILAVIPARYASTRFPGKVLADINGKSMIQRVYECAQRAKRVDEVVIATDDERVQRHVEDFGGTAVMTSPDHQSGTERVAEVANRYTQHEFFLNLQGDEPFIFPDHIDALCTALIEGEDQPDIATLIRRANDADDLANPGEVKVVTDLNGKALYFSRAVIPHPQEGGNPAQWLEQYTYYLHVGVYGFRREVLLKIPNMAPTPAEQIESLEQLRWLAHGYAVRTALVEGTTMAVETPEDLERLLAKIAAGMYSDFPE